MNNPRTLIIDPRDRMSINIESMNKLGFVTDVAHSEIDALDKVDKNPYEFIWLDVDEDLSINYTGIDLVYKIRHYPTMNISTPIHGFTDKKGSPYTLKPKEFGLEVCVRYLDSRYLEKIAALLNKNESAIKNGTFKPSYGYAWFNEQRALTVFYDNKPRLKEALKGMAFEQIPGLKEQLHHYHVEQNWVCMFNSVYDFANGAHYLGLNNLHNACQVFSSYQNSHEAQSLEDLYQFIIDIMDKTVFHLRCWIEKN